MKRVISFLIVLTVLLSALLPATVSAASDPANGTGTLDSIVLPGTQTAPVGNNFHRSGLRAATGAELGFKAGATSFVKDGKILGTHPETDVAAFLATLADAAGVTISDASGKAKTKGKIATGDKVSYGGASYTIVIDGDVTADGKLDAFDFQMLKAHVLGNYTIPENQLLAADTTGDKLIDAFDFQMLKAHVLGTFDMFEKYKPTDDPTPGHKHDYKAVVTAPTCTEKGYTTYTCSCGDSYKDNYKDSLGHNWIAATCTAPKTCSRCHTTEGKPTPHSYVLEIVKDEALKAEATCSGAAVYYKSCVCGKISTNDEDVFTYGEHLDHLFALEIVRDEAMKSKATCEDAAVYYKSCTCGEISKDASDTFTSGTATGHSYKETSSTDATCTEAATVTYSCECCKAFYTETVGDPLEHDIAGVTAVEKPVKNCEYVLTYTCKREGCGAEVEGEHVFHHNYTASITKEPTCKDDGEKTLTCTCGDVKTETLPKDASAHQWVKGEPDPAGVRTDECSCCKETKTVTVFTGTVTDEIATDALKDSEIEVGGIGLSFDAGAADALGDDPVTLGAETLDDGEKESLGLSKEQLKQIGDNPIYNLTVTGEAGNISRFGEDNYVTVTIPYEPADGEDVDSIAIWYIDDKGEPEAIKAVYRGGFVTFATNHFSCYTVTRLTNEERCALYGHSYEITHIPGNCTANSYDLYVCVRCHETHTENVVAAPGHDYAEETHPATCTEDGYILYSCKNCPRTYRTKLPATGHEWSVVKTVDATCTAPGSVTYGCAHCTETYSVATAMLPHVFSESVVTKQPTCEEPGESVAKCATCDETIVTPIPATGHEWNVLKTTDATCSKPGSVTYKCGTCGKEKTTEIPATGKHIYENGKCKYCGRSETECDHTKLHTVTIDFAEYGCCEGYITYETCDCGEYIMPASSDITCEFEVLEHEEGEDENGLWYEIIHQKCKICGFDVYAHSYYQLTENPCLFYEHTEYSLKRNGVVIWEAHCKYAGEAHDDVRTEVDATEFGICGGTLDCYRCTVCGKITYIRDVDLTCPVDFNHYDEETFEDENGNLHTVRKVVCPDCGFTVYAEIWTEEESSCVEYECNVQRIFCGDNVLYEHEFFGRMDHHIYETTYNLLGESCEDGVEVTLHCTVCGETVTYTEYYHETTYRDIDLSEYGLCGGELEERYCEVCGKIFSTSVYNERCKWGYQGESKDGYNVYVCVQCGAVKYTRYTEGEKDENCLCSDVYETIYFVDGEEVLRYERYEDYYNHDMKYSYNFLGETCEDGVEVTEYCPDCGHTYTYTFYGHEYDYRYIDLADFGLCGGEIEEEYCILCGTVLNSRVTSEDCAFEYVDTLEDGTEIYECSICGARNTWRKEIGEKDENCEYTTTTTNCYFVNGEEVYRSVDRRNYVNHAYEYTYVLLGETCKDGVEVTEYCTVCGYTHTWVRTDHYSDVRYTSLEDYGMCKGDLSEEYCVVCGEIIETYVSYCSCRMMYQGTDENGYDIYTCKDCGVTRMTRETALGEKDEYCCRLYEDETIFIIDGKVVLSFTNRYETYEHAYEYKCVFDGETCDDGVHVTETCPDCGLFRSYYAYGHGERSEKVDMEALGLCGGYMREVYCKYCGELLDSYLVDSPCHFIGIGFDDEGREVFVCSECGTQMRVFTESVKDENCNVLVTETDEYVVNGEVVYTKISSYSYEAHDWEYSYELLGESCEDGVIQSAHCKYCGADRGYTKTYSEHSTAYTEQIDLSQFGCVCGGYVTLRSCACRQTSWLDLDDTRCDFDWFVCDCWIENVLTGSQWSTSGYSDFNFNANLYICAVTSPACGFTIRYAIYWLRSEDQPCTAVQYETWQFGYDIETDTCAYELTCNTGNTALFHDYTENSQQDENGYSHEYVCKTCGSSYTVTYRKDQYGRTIKDESIAVNTLDNGDNKYLQYTYEYDYDDNGEQCLYRYYRKVVYADGTEYWYEEITETTDYDVPFGDYGKKETVTYSDSDGDYSITERAYARFNDFSKEYPIYEYYTSETYWDKYDYTYSFENGCMRTVTYSDSDGDEDHYEEECCHFRWDHTLLNPTCTQDGMDIYKCAVCGKEALSLITPYYGHSWVRKSDGTYFCSNCGMENANGADGSIIMEDLTNAHGNGEYYVVGYYLRNDSIDFTKYVTLLLPDGSEIIVDGIEFTTLDDLRCVAFKKADVEAFAEENGYTDYLVRFTFVPYDDDFDLDYSVIFYDIQPLTLITGTVEFMDSVSGGQTKTYLITPTEDAVWTITSYSGIDPYAKLYDAEGNVLADNDDGGTDYNFFLTYELKAGETYTLVIDWYGDPYGYFDLVFTCEP